MGGTSLYVYVLSDCVYKHTESVHALWNVAFVLDGIASVSSLFL